MKLRSVAVWCVCTGLLPAAFAQTATEGLAKLRDGNRKYVEGKFDTAHTGDKMRKALAAGQHPFATVLTCADSRVPPELIFDQGLGDLFVIRVAGLVPDQTVLGSVEYAAEHLHVPLLIVMGHTSCGAVKSAMESTAPAHVDEEHANLERILSAIRPSLPHARQDGDKWTNAVYASLDQNLSDAVHHSPVLAHLMKEGKVTVIGAVYDINTGKVSFSEPIHVASGKEIKAVFPK